MTKSNISLYIVQKLVASVVHFVNFCVCVGDGGGGGGGGGGSGTWDRARILVISLMGNKFNGYVMHMKLNWGCLAVFKKR